MFTLFYKNNFIRTIALLFGEKFRTMKNKLSLESGLSVTNII